MTYVIVHFLKLDPSKFTFLAPKTNSHGGHFIPIKYNGKSLYVNYEPRTCPFGISTGYEGKSTGDSTYILLCRL